MTADATLDALGLRGALPCPGWVVLDAARDRRFTGELDATVDGVDGQFRVSFDRGRIYVAERSTDPPLGIRLVEAGAINHAQLEYGTLRIGEIQHLGRLFDRVPSINRDSVLVMNQLMTEECVRAMAARQVVEVTATPYRHHESGMHRWEAQEPIGGASVSGVAPPMALPAPSPDARPVVTEATSPAEPAAPEPAAIRPGPADDPHTDDHDDVGGERPEATDERRRDAELFVDDVVEWDEPSLLVATATARHHRRGSAPRDLFATAPANRDWADDLGPGGVTDDALDTTVAPAQLTPVPVPAIEQFELIWPSGETVDLAADAPIPTDDLDRTASSARLGSADRAPDFAPPRPDAAGSPHPADHDPETPDARKGFGRDDGTDRDAGSPALAVRRAVATIDTGSLEARRRLAASPGEPLTPPGRLVVSRDHSSWRTSELPATSVFDEQPASFDEAPRTTAPSGEHHRGRVGALRRLIDSLRRD